MERNNIPRIIFRLGNIVFSRDFVETLKSHGIILSRANRFKNDAIIINHGNTNEISASRKVRNLYVINYPSYIKYCSNKWLNYKILKDFYPYTQLSTKINSDFALPLIAKPLNGHHGYGILEIKTPEELEELLHSHNTYLIQEKIDIKHEYRFNVFDGKVFQVSHRDKIPDRTQLGGFIFNYRSLGENAKLKSIFWEFVYNVIRTFKSSIPLKYLSSYSVDVMKGTDNKYYLSEINSAYGIGLFTLNKLIRNITEKYNSGELEKYRVI